MILIERSIQKYIVSDIHDKVVKQVTACACVVNLLLTSDSLVIPSFKND